MRQGRHRALRLRAEGAGRAAQGMRVRLARLAAPDHVRGALRDLRLRQVCVPGQAQPVPQRRQAAGFQAAGQHGAVRCQVSEISAEFSPYLRQPHRQGRGVARLACARRVDVPRRGRQIYTGEWQLARVYNGLEVGPGSLSRVDWAVVDLCPCQGNRACALLVERVLLARPLGAAGAAGAGLRPRSTGRTWLAPTGRPRGPGQCRRARPSMRLPRQGCGLQFRLRRRCRRRRARRPPPRRSQEPRRTRRMRGAGRPRPLPAAAAGRFRAPRRRLEGTSAPRPCRPARRTRRPGRLLQAAQSRPTGRSQAIRPRPRRGTGQRRRPSAARPSGDPMYTTAAGRPPADRTDASSASAAAAAPYDPAAPASVTVPDNEGTPAYARAASNACENLPWAGGVASSSAWPAAVGGPCVAFSRTACRDSDPALSAWRASASASRRALGSRRNTASPSTAREGAVEPALTSTIPLSEAYGIAACRPRSVEGPTYTDGPEPPACAARRAMAADTAAAPALYSVALTSSAASVRPCRSLNAAAAAAAAMDAPPPRSSSSSTPICRTGRPGSGSIRTAGLPGSESEPGKPGSGRTVKAASPVPAAAIELPLRISALAPAYERRPVRSPPRTAYSNSSVRVPLPDAYAARAPAEPVRSSR